MFLTGGGEGGVVDTSIHTIPSPVFLSFSEINPICFVNKSNTAIFQETVMII